MTDTNSQKYFQVIPAEDYALLNHRDDGLYVDRIVAFGLTDAGVENQFRHQLAGRLVPLIVRNSVVDGKVVSRIEEASGQIVHTSTFLNDQAKVTALKSGKPLVRL